MLSAGKTGMIALTWFPIVTETAQEGFKGRVSRSGQVNPDLSFYLFGRPTRSIPESFQVTIRNSDEMGNAIPRNATPCFRTSLLTGPLEAVRGPQEKL